MDDLIKINYETEQPTVSARDLHEGLEIKTAFKDWFPRMCEYGFEKGKDFNPLIFEQVQTKRESQIATPLKHRFGTLDIPNRENC